MSLGIFSFDLAALINSLSNFIEVAETGNAPAGVEATLDKVEAVLENADASDSIIDDVLMAAAINSTINSVMTAAEPSKKENSTEKPQISPAPLPANRLDEETRKEIERLIKSLQTSVVHNYRSSDIVDEAVSLHRVANFPKRILRENEQGKTDAAERDRKREAQKIEALREELQKAILRNNSGV